MAKEFIYRTVKKTQGTEVVGSSQVNQGTGGSGSSGGGGSSLNPTLGELLNVSSSADSQTVDKMLKWDVVQGLWVVTDEVIAKTTLGSLDNVDPITDNPDVGDSFAVLGTNNNGVSYKPFTLPETLGGAVFEGDVSAQQTNAFVVDFGKDLGDNYNLEVQGWNEKTVPWNGEDITIRNVIQAYDIVKTTIGFSVKFFENVDFLSYKALTTISPTPAPEAPHVTIRMSGAGLMDFSITGATGVKWIMQDGTVYDQDSQVPSGDINRPQIVFSGAGWVKLYCDNFSVASCISGAGNGARMTSSLSDFNVYLYRLQFDNCPSLTGEMHDIKATKYFSVRDANSITGRLTDISTMPTLTTLVVSRCSKITGDLADASNVSAFVEFRGSEITSNSNEINCAANTMYLQDNGFSQQELKNLITYNYNLNNQNKTLNITNNTVPDAETIAMIDEMQTNRGWVILYDHE